tara:strand:+ start:32831 stop:34576 length:1746 start_codon:yes stop_codon:yes gene_type:complete
MEQFTVVISEIKIKNIRGFLDITLPFNIRPNCANILVAPNGFGKSSISTAFQCATGRKLNASEEQKHSTLRADPSEFSICVDGSWLIADANKNEITDTFDVHVVKSGLTPKAKVPRINGVPIPKPYMEIPSLDLGVSKSKEDLAFDLKAHKAQLGQNAKVVPNFTKKCEAPDIRRSLLASISSIDKLTQVKPRKLFNDIISFAAGASGTKIDISEKAEGKFSEEIEESEHISAVMHITQNIQGVETWLDRVFICYQAADLCKENRANFKKWLEYGAYQASLSAAKAFISDINNAWVGAQVKERKGRVVVEFPEANALSNGQRDLLYFGCNMLRARQVVSKKPCIIVIDEVFDYLDDANIMVAQYFLSKMIDLYKGEGRKVFICLLTHLDPAFFKGYALRKQKTIYLQNGSQKVSNTMKKVVGDREDPAWKEDLEKYFLHYHPDEKNLSELFNDTFGLPKAHGRNHSFYDFLREEWGKCSSEAEEYDPFAVCAHVRIEIERIAYCKLSGEEERDEFINTHGTANKLRFCEAAGVQVPESCYLLGVIYNDALHQRGAIDQSSSIALKLKNIALLGVIKNALDW